MWGFAANAVGSNMNITKPGGAPSECSDDEPSLNSSREEGLECPICWESFNIVENVPCVLWCGHTLCKNCIEGLQRAIVRLPTLPIQLPFFISCPWCNLLSFRLVCKGNLRFPNKNYILLWMVESMNGDRSKSCASIHGNIQQPLCSSVSRYSDMANQVSRVNNRRSPSPRPVEPPLSHGYGTPQPKVSHRNAQRLQGLVRKSLVFFVQLTAKFPLIVVFLLIVLYAIPASAAVLTLYICLQQFDDLSA